LLIWSILVGPVGAGKSTVAHRLAQLVRLSRMTAADVDMDDVAFMQCGGDDLYEFWRRSAVATAGLIRSWFDAGVDVAPKRRTLRAKRDGCSYPPATNTTTT
jgi:hypothetical protein